MKRTLIFLFAQLAVLALFLVCQLAACGQSASRPIASSAPFTPPFNQGQLSKAQSLIGKLEKLDAVMAGDQTSAEYRARVEPLVADVFKRASSLPESDFKTDLATAARFFELSGQTRNELETSESASTRCAEEKPGAYRRLCESTTGSPRQLLLAKAHLHMAWAKATVQFRLNGATDVALLREIEIERKNDYALARSALATLRLLENEVAIHASLSDFQSNEMLARVPYETFSDQLRGVSTEVGKIVSWLPQNRLKFEICNALYSYQDGGLRWATVYQPKVISVFNLSSPVNAQSATAYQLTVPYTVAVNWRQASKHLQRAEDILGRLESTDPSL